MNSREDRGRGTVDEIQIRDDDACFKRVIDPRLESEDRVEDKDVIPRTFQGTLDTACNGRVVLEQDDPVSHESCLRPRPAVMWGALG